MNDKGRVVFDGGYKCLWVDNRHHAVVGYIVLEEGHRNVDLYILAYVV